LKPTIEEELQDRVAGQREDALAKAKSDLENYERTAVLFAKKLDEERALHSDETDKTLDIELAREELENAQEVRRRIADRAREPRTIVQRIAAAAEPKSREREADAGIPRTHPRL
jgi:hypothetical protein